jgi:hypothetical protein
MLISINQQTAKPPYDGIATTILGPKTAMRAAGEYQQTCD